MTTTPQPREPIESDPDRIVEGTHLRPRRWWELLRRPRAEGPGWPSYGTEPSGRERRRGRPGVPDTGTQQRMEEYLVERMTPTPVPRKGYVRIPNQDRTPATWESGIAWAGGSPRNHLIVMTTVFVLANAVANGVPVYGALRQVWDHFFGQDRVELVEQPDATFEVQDNLVAETDPDGAVIALAADEIETALQRGATITDVTITGIASDEYSEFGDAALGRIDPENIAYATARAERDAQALIGELAARNITGITITTGAEERVLDADDLARLEALRVRFGYESVTAAELAHRENPWATPPELADALDVLADGRGARIDIGSVDQVSVTIPRPPVDREPFQFIPAFLPPLPWARRRPGSAPRFIDVPVSDDYAEFVKLYPEALRADQTLVADAWKFTRKYQNLLREEGRIRRVIRLDYIDGLGEPQRLRAIFVDHEPSVAEVAMVEDTLRTLSLARDGRIAEDLDLIAIYPTDHTGMHGRPKDVGLGIDIQYDRGTLGVAIPALGIVEMHLDPEATFAELWASQGPRHTLVHETLGHFSDLHAGEDVLVPVPEVTTIEAYRSRPRWADVGIEDYQSIIRDPQHQHYFITRVATAPDGTQYTVEEVVLSQDPRLARAAEIAKSGFVTPYATTHPAEHYAEAVAAALDGIALESAGDLGPAPLAPEPGFADRYGPQPSTGALIRTRLGADPEVTDTLVFPSPTHDRIRASWQVTVGDLNDDPELMLAAWDAHQTPMPKELIGIVVPRRFDGGPAPAGPEPAGR